ncbi:ribosome biogenesis GTPase Der [Candidatus Steffania adelgidicola]|uniref:ribosome biogenesis GTPase Der n=1 Tax=Candidatus Steffania adelgidicola TaxID=1076626 RepID=UPI001D034C30|nr:ribosome biogenesis GTPase Der [Candidatus Steffania adelgidicola]UDG80016.1 GTPase Der [Candidatus Steffania adelgidicola]
MIPVIALVGRPNVGKSTLFNQLTCTRDALVSDFFGLTRDRKYGRGQWKNNNFIVLDTSGIDSTEGGVETRMLWQSLKAIEEADIVFFIVDARSGLMAADQDIAQHLRIRQKTTVVIANKIDGVNVNNVLSEFYSLGMGDVFPISASHGHAIDSLLERFLPSLMREDDLDAGSSLSLADNKIIMGVQKDEKTLLNPKLLPIKLAIVGRPNVGKSTLTNYLLGEERVLVYDMPGTTRDSIYIPMMHDEQQYILIDTAGVRKSSKVIKKVEEFSIVKTLQAIQDANVVLLIVDAREGISDQDLSLLSFIIHSGRSLVIGVNKWDRLSCDKCEEVRKSLKRRIDFVNFARVHFISALYGDGVGKLFHSVNEAYQCATKRVSTALLTRIMRIAINEHQPPMLCGRRIKPKYAHAGGYNPPIVVIHGTQVQSLPDAYKRYLKNYFCNTLKIIGTPIRIQFKNAFNPFSSRHNVLTPTQLRKRKRLISHFKKNKSARG